MTEILDAFREIFMPPVAYCVICLRSERERRLVDITSLETLMKTINLPFDYREELQRVCWVCARRALAATRLLLAVQLSGALHELFAEMRRLGNYPRLAAMLAGQKPKSGAAREAEEWSRRLAEVRARSALRTTDVLVIASPTAADPPAPPAPAPADPPRPAPACCALPDDASDPLQLDDESSQESRLQLVPEPPPLTYGLGDVRAPAPPLLRCEGVPGLLTYSIVLEDEAPPQAKSATDWEDKIPMDVISYVDAVDPQAALYKPRPPALYMPPLAPQPPAPAPQPVTTQHDDVIDLC